MKTNYDVVMENLIKNVKPSSKLLLHVCCGPCSSAVLERLKDIFDITILYYNPNIYPKEEYEKRLNTLNKLLLKSHNDIPVVTLPYDEDVFLSKTKSFEDEKEGGKRCHICYLLRLEETAKYAKEHGFDYFTTTLTISPYKDSEVLNEIGISLEKKYDVKYLCSDFKKKNGYKKSIELSKKYELYRQDYCGCRYSLRDALEYKKNI